MEVPLWALILEAAGGDPLRAQEIEAGLTQRWWYCWMAYFKEKNEAANEAAKGT